MEFIWFCPMLKDETMPKPASHKEYFTVLLYKHGHEGARKHLSIVSHAKVNIILWKTCKIASAKCFYPR